MAEITNEMVYENIVEIKEKIGKIEHMLEEDFELSDEAKKELKEARATPESEYVDLE